MRFMRILVTGGAGFIGSHVVDALVKRGDTVVVLDDLSSGSLENLAHAKDAEGKGVTLVHRSIAEPLDDVFEKARPDAVIHLAAQIDVRKSVKDPQADAMINIIGGLNLIAACERHGVKRVVFSSTGGALYGETDELPTPETHAIVPESPYGIAKRSLELYFDFYRSVHGLRPVVLRFANVYGPRQALKGEAGVVAVFTKALLRGEQPTVFGDGKQTRDYVYVGDVVAAIVAVLDENALGAFNVGTGVETSVTTLYRKLAKLLDNPWAPKHGAAVPGELQRSCLDATALTGATGWKPRVTLDEGLATTVAWFQEHATK